jgi:S1-C subfamily serine protease
MIYSPSGGSVGIGFAVPVETARRVVNDLLQFGRVRKPSLGISPILVNGQLARVLDLPVREGLLIAEVTPGGAASRAGIRGASRELRYGPYLIPVGGDILVGINGQPIRNTDDLDGILNTKSIGDQLKVEVIRGTERLTLTVTLAELPRGGRRI